MPPKINTDVMILGSGHSIMYSHLNYKPKIASDRYSEIKTHREDFENFGLFGGNSYNTFYPDVKPEQFNPKNSEFIEPMFRLLSACIVQKSYNPTEFSEQVLKDSIPLIIGQTVNCDHETDIANAIGTVKDAFWQDSFTQDGVTIPGGINGVLKIDGVANPRIARGIMMDPPSIHSNSVTVQFEWEPSHYFENPWEFYDKIGTYDEKGELIRRLVTKIVSYRETSLVSHGADPFAQMITPNGILNPKYASSVYYGQYSDNPQDLTKKFYFFDFKGNKEVDILYNTDRIFNKQQSNNPQMNQELLTFIQSLFGEGLLTLNGGNPTEDLVRNSIQELVKTVASYKATKETQDLEISDLKTQVSSLTSQVESLKHDSEVAKLYVSEIRESTINSYKKLMGEDNLDSAIINLLETTNVETLKALKKTYDVQLEDKFPLHCADCGSKNVNRSSSVNPTNTDEPQNQASYSDIYTNLEKLAKAKEKK